MTSTRAYIENPHHRQLEKRTLMHASKNAARTILLASNRPNRLSPFGAGWLWSLGILLMNVLPVVFQSLHRSGGLGEDLLGTLGTALVLGFGISTASGPIWIYRSNPKSVALAGLLVSALGMLGITFAASASDQIYWWFVAGLANGCVATPAFTALGVSENPLRAYSLASFASLVFAAAASYALPLFVVPHFGDKGLLVALALIFIVSLPAALTLPALRGRIGAKHPAASGAPEHARRASLTAPILAALSGAIFMGVFMGGVYTFIDSLASAVGIGAQAVDPVIAIGLVTSMIGSILPAVLGHRVNTTIVMAICSVCVVLTYPAMMSHSLVTFSLGFIMHGVFGVLGYTYSLGIVRRLDFTDRLYIAYPALQSLGLAIETSFAGYLLAHFSTKMLFGTSAVLIGFSLLLLLIAGNMAARTCRAKVGMPCGAPLI
ncbi:hypothetical protein [Paraburkholderia bannensis]|uniref:hypothetical protein n=1 Tax=Paraburkholderia bannensis TaxID=765414 RepID=UPI002ABE5AC8|nr:hypothetical protein [Paraburkholderia bannensis]